jgi:hypothetical protein
MRGEDEELYLLAGETGDVRPGDHVVVEGTLGRSARCRSGTSLQLLRIERGPPGS